MEEARHRAIDDVYAEVEPWFFDALVKLGYPITQIAEPRFVYNAQNLAFHVSTRDFWEVTSRASVAREETVMGTFYSHPWEWEIGDRHLIHAEQSS